MRYTKKTYAVEAIRVQGCEITINRPGKEDLTATEGDFLLQYPNGSIEVMPAEDFMKSYEVEKDA